MRKKWLAIVLAVTLTFQGVLPVMASDLQTIADQEIMEQTEETDLDKTDEILSVPEGSEESGKTADNTEVEKETEENKEEGSETGSPGSENETIENGDTTDPETTDENEEGGESSEEEGEGTPDEKTEDGGISQTEDEGTSDTETEDDEILDTENGELSDIETTDDDILETGGENGVEASEKPQEPARARPKLTGQLLVHYDADSFETLADGDKIAGLTNQASDSKYSAKQDDPNYQPVYVEHSDLNGLPAMRLEDSSYLQIGEDGGFDLENMTMAVVLKPGRLDAEKSQICSRKKNNSGDHNWYWNIEGRTGLNFGWKEQGADNWCSPGSRPILAAGEEYVLIVQKNGTQGSVFVNGKETSFTGAAIPEFNGENVYLGAPAGNSDGEVSINADICEFRIYDYALSETERETLQTELNEKYLEDSSQGELPVDQLPGEVAGLKVWLDADDLMLADGDPVTEWKNKANSNQLHAVQQDTAHQPEYIASSDFSDDQTDRPAVRLDKGLYLELDKQIHPDDMSIFAVMHADSLEGGGDDNQIVSKLGNRDPWNHNWYFNISGGGLNFGWKDLEGYHDYQNPNRKLSTDVNYILGGVKDGNKGSLYINQARIGEIYSAAADPAAFHNDTPIYIGGTGTGKSMTGMVGEILIYDCGLTTEEAAKVQEYLGDKWGIEKAEDPSSMVGKITIDGQELRAFSPNTDTYCHTLAAGTTAVPVVTADFTAGGATAVVTQASELPGKAEITVQKGGTVKTYTISFSVLDREVLDLQQPSVDEVTISDGYWKDYMDLFQKETIHHVLDNFERTGTLENFKNAGISGRSPDRRTDPWNDGLLFETIRGAADFMRKNPDAALKQRIDGYVDIVYEASLRSENGYLSTWAMMERPGRYFDETGNARWYHDCYNFGCMAEAAVHYYRATGETKLLYVATRYAEFLVDNYGYGTKADGTAKINMVPSHEGPEEMLLKLYELYRDTPGLKDQVNAHTTPDIGELTIDEEEYKDLVAFWIENRGNYDNRVNGVSYDVYAQDHERYFDQEVAAGHAVRANLFYTGMAAAGLEFRDYTYLSSAERIWQNIVDKQMYITGGVGAQGADEAYGPNYDLPNDGYCETCAQVAMGFFSEYMGLAFGESKYADILENYIYNGVLGCVGQDGRSFYYQQPLTDKNRGRWEWIEHTPCCPPMFLKFYGELPTYIYAYNGGNVYVNQFISSQAALNNGVNVKQDTEMPWGGTTTIQVTGNTRLHIRIPDWADVSRTVLQINGQTTRSMLMEDGYAVVDINGSAEITLALPMEARREYSDSNVVYNEGKTALAYGPLVYCVESTDNDMVPEFSLGDGNIGLPMDAELHTRFENDLLNGVQTITFEGQYYDSNGELQTTQMKAIPFYVRSNRGNSATFVWINETVQRKTGRSKRWLAHATSTRDNGNSAAAAFDGNKDTYWSAGSPEIPQALIVDLGKETRISRIVTTFTSAQAWKYQVMYSSDAETWEVYADRSLNAVNQQEYVDENELTARYVAVKFVESAGVGFISVKEIEVLDDKDQNLALNKLCGASSTSNVGESVFAALDGEEKTRYCPPNEAKPQVLTMDLGQQADITGIDILFEKPTDWTYYIEVSEDGEQWDPYFGETASLTEKKIEKEAKGRYVRFGITETTGGVWASAWEFDVKTRQDLVDVFDVLFGRIKDQVTVTARAEAHGSISPDGEIVLKKGDDIRFTVSPENGYQIRQVLANEKVMVQEQEGIYVLADVQEDTEVLAQFEETDTGGDTPPEEDKPSEGGDSPEGDRPSGGDNSSEGDKPSGGDNSSEGDRPSGDDSSSKGDQSSGESHSSGRGSQATDENISSGGTSEVTGNGEVPPTGDESPIGPALLGVMVSMVFVAVLMRLKKRSPKVK